MKKCNACELYPAIKGKNKCKSCIGIINHIKEQNLKQNFTECSKCETLFPKGTECPVCRF